VTARHGGCSTTGIHVAVGGHEAWRCLRSPSGELARVEATDALVGQTARSRRLLRGFLLSLI
jgi:hypothetical protein